jgi:hypothetical protein
MAAWVMTAGPLRADDNLAPARRGRPTGGVSSATSVVVAVPVHEASALKLDGELTDEVWDRAPKIEGFVQRDPKEGAPPTYPTEARVAYDGANIYVAVIAHDPEPAKIVGHLTRRDTSTPSDWIRVAIDSYFDKRTAYEFSVNPVGVKQDKYYFNDGNGEDQGWDAVWDVVVSRHASGWRAEFRIPLSQLRFPAADQPTFGLAFAREIGRLNETSTWPLIAKSVNGIVSQFGELRGLALTQSPKRLELVPYTVADVSTEPETDNPLVDEVDPGVEVGLDLKYAITPGLTLTATVNPDFGQVEADPAVVNLSAFETFFNERRPFFVEGSGMFAFDMDGLFYSRRIGRPPQLDPDTSDDAFVASPINTTILGATKVTGRAGGFSIGILNALTAEEEAQIAIASLRTTSPIEPFSSYTVGRARKEFKNQSNVGFMMTATNRNTGDELSPMRLLSKAAYTGGLDWDWRLWQKYSVTGHAVGSTIRGTPAAIARLQESNVHSFQRPDADHVEFDPTRTTLTGQGGAVTFAKISGERVRFNSGMNFRTPGFDSNDLGFMRRADEIFQFNWIQWRHDKPGKYIRSFRFNLNQWSSHNFDGDRLFMGGNVNAHWTFKNNWNTGGGLNKETQGFDDRATRGGPGALYEGNWNFWGYVDTDNRKPISLNLFSGGGTSSEFGIHFYDFNPSVTYRPMSALSVSGGVRFSQFDQDAQWVENVDGADGQTHYVFARLDQQTVALTTRVNYTMTPNLSLQVYAEPFVSAGEYTGYKELVEGRAKDWRDRYAPYAYAGNADFNYRSFRTTNVLRWEYKPGSALFVVWQQGREESESFGNFRYGRDFRGVFGIPASNVFLVKLSYWLNY